MSKDEKLISLNEEKKNRNILMIFFDKKKYVEHLNRDIKNRSYVPNIQEDW